MQDLYKSFLYNLKKPLLVFFLIILISLIVLAKEYTQDYNDPISYSMGDSRWCRISGSCILTSLILDSLTVYNLSVIGQVFNVTVNRVTWNITESINIEGNMSIGGNVSADYYFGDGSQLTGISAEDGLGNHTASEDLNMSGWNITNANKISTTVSGNELTLTTIGSNADLELHVDDIDFYTNSNLAILKMHGESSQYGGYIQINRQPDAGQLMRIGAIAQYKHTFIGIDDTFSDFNLIIADTSNIDSQNFDHGTQSNPTLWIQSATDPDSDNTQWLGLWHDQVNSNIDSGKGNITLKDFTDIEGGLNVDDNITASNYLGNGDTLDNIVANPMQENLNASEYNITNTGSIKPSGDKVRVYFDNYALVIAG